MYCTAPLSPRKGRLISFHDDDDDDDDDGRTVLFAVAELLVICSYEKVGAQQRRMEVTRHPAPSSAASG